MNEEVCPVGTMAELDKLREEVEEWRSGLAAGFGICTASPHRTLVDLARDLEAHHQAHHRREEKTGVELVELCERNRQIEAQAAAYRRALSERWSGVDDAPYVHTHDCAYQRATDLSAAALKALKAYRPPDVMAVAERVRSYCAVAAGVAIFSDRKAYGPGYKEGRAKAADVIRRLDLATLLSESPPEPEPKKPLMVRNLSTHENRRFWDFIEENAKVVASWPAWKRGASGVDEAAPSAGCARCGKHPDASEHVYEAPRPEKPTGFVESRVYVDPDGSTCAGKPGLAGEIEPPEPAIRLIANVFNEVVEERRRQDAKWGEQNHLDGTCTGTLGILAVVRGTSPAAARDNYEMAVDAGRLTWADILWEEIAEAFDESNESRLRAELVQVVAVGIAWIECIDRRQK